MTTQILPDPNVKHTPISVHVVPVDIDDERIRALLDRYLEVIEAGQHPPYWYIGKIFSELYAIRMARRAAEATP